ncbi:MAG: hypothetical protein GY697_23495, partial [Desulfobacterales bacterium]|nr:hypothetical protein [Desulfobacterales bacterium]
MQRWKMWLPTLAILGLLAWWAIEGLQKSLLILNNGQSLIAEEIHTVGDEVFYRNGISVKAVPTSQVQQIVTASLTDPSCYLPLLEAHSKRSLAKLSVLKPPASGAGITQHPLFFQAKSHLPLIAGGFLGLLLLLMGIRGWRQYHRKKAVATGSP